MVLYVIFWSCVLIEEGDRYRVIIWYGKAIGKRVAQQKGRHIWKAHQWCYMNNTVSKRSGINTIVATLSAGYIALWLSSHSMRATLYCSSAGRFLSLSVHIIAMTFLSYFSIPSLSYQDVAASLHQRFSAFQSSSKVIRLLHISFQQQIT